MVAKTRPNLLTAEGTAQVSEATHIQGSRLLSKLYLLRIIISTHNQNPQILSFLSVQRSGTSLPYVAISSANHRAGHPERRPCTLSQERCAREPQRSFQQPPAASSESKNKSPPIGLPASLNLAQFCPLGKGKQELAILNAGGGGGQKGQLNYTRLCSWVFAISE